MKKNLALNLFLILSFIFTSCSGDDNSDTPINEVPEIMTLSATNLDGANVTLGGNITNDGGSEIQMRGVCWSTNNLPTRDNENYKEDFLNQIGSFQFSVENQLQPNTVYYARAYVSNQEGEFEYGNVISFTTGNLNFLTTLPPTDILTKKATLRGGIIQNPNEFSEIRFVYSTLPTPTINDLSTYPIGISGTDTFEVVIENLQHNTVYYVRTVVSFNDTYFYGEQKEFRTTGYTGPAGGYVTYDMGEENEGWRFLEIYPVTLNHNINISNGANWGPDNIYISGLSDQFGSGPNNTQIIINTTSAYNCAARLVDNYVKNGYSDWFLPSKEELKLISKSLNGINISLDWAWSSTQHDTEYAYRVQSNAISDISYKENYLNVFPVRRYL